MELYVDNILVVVKVDVGSIVVDMEVEVCTMAVDIMFPSNVVSYGVPMAVDVLLCSFQVVMYDVDVGNVDSIMTNFIINNSRIVIFTKMKKRIYVTQLCHG